MLCSLIDVGINDDFIKKTRAAVTEGTSAVFLLTSNAVDDRVTEGFKALPPYDLTASNVSAEEKTNLKEVFAELSQQGHWSPRQSVQRRSASFPQCLDVGSWALKGAHECG